MAETTIAVIGAGIMGSDVALDLACYGHTVLLIDRESSILEQSREKITKEFKLVKMMKKDAKDLSIEDIFNNIEFTTEYSSLSKVKIIIENITEDWDAKKDLYEELQKHCGPETYYAANTSCISITRIASLLPNAEKVIGLHFMNPVPLKNIVETVRGYHTSDDTVEYITAFLKTLNKKAIVVNDFPGFVANRLSHLFMNEAAMLIQDGVAGAGEIDLIFKQGYGHKMGPLETADLIGLDTVVNSLEVLYESYQDPKFRCCPLLKKMVHAGLLGKKSGEGFYTYSGGK
ncbi:MAG: 3-hydroxyacyl-CoA dehydrogenase family protein [bacterium]|nr:3-hydroxyacyl-CoA dehydrogenase family protein [bacterium]